MAVEALTGEDIGLCGPTASLAVAA
jgi:hypothetical protein